MSSQRLLIYQILVAVVFLLIWHIGSSVSIFGSIFCLNSFSRRHRMCFSAL